ncbi:hypothetical protein LCGC14_1500800 [marine sediment metagenome]|uniref:Uncharacterized protein n=1 Tax=marine sediment metagenome TaxID=412755 RepID=A0A0F9J434_9ZZZZ
MSELGIKQAHDHNELQRFLWDNTPEHMLVNPKAPALKQDKQLMAIQRLHKELTKQHRKEKDHE